MATKDRLDQLLLQAELAANLHEAQGLILAGRVIANGLKVDKPGTRLPITTKLEITNRCPYVSRGGLKLAGALDFFKVNPNGMICADTGSSTGGFTDVLLKRGARQVYAIDKAHGELAWKLRTDPRVTVMERVDASALLNLPQKVDLVTLDISLLPLRTVLPAAAGWIANHGSIIALLKPQYEALPEELPEGAIISDPSLHKQIIGRVQGQMTEYGLASCGLCDSPIEGKSGNKEFFILLRKTL